MRDRTGFWIKQFGHAITYSTKEFTRFEILTNDVINLCYDIRKFRYLRGIE